MIKMHVLITHSSTKYSEKNDVSVFRVEERKNKNKYQKMEEKRARTVYICLLLDLHSPSVLKLDTTVFSEMSAPVYQNIRRYMQDC
jgi:hypothetical protein